MKEIIVALVTPFDENNEINYSILDEIIAYNIEQGADGFFIGGSAGEGMLLTLDEKLALFEYLAKYCNKLNLIANVSALGEKESVLLAKSAERFGYNAVSSVIPYYYKHSMESIALYYSTIMDSVDIPMIIYNFPLNSGVEFDLENADILALFKNPNVLGIKHTNRNLYEMEKIMRINPNLLIYCGYDEVYLNALPLNINGAIGSTFNITTAMFKKIGLLYEQGKIDEALVVQKRANIIMDALIKVGLIPGIKHALEYLGMNVGNPRVPFRPLDDASKVYLEKTIDEQLY